MRNIKKNLSAFGNRSSASRNGIVFSSNPASKKEIPPRSEETQGNQQETNQRFKKATTLSTKLRIPRTVPTVHQVFAAEIFFCYSVEVEQLLMPAA